MRAGCCGAHGCEEQFLLDKCPLASPLSCLPGLLAFVLPDAETAFRAREAVYASALGAPVPVRPAASVLFYMRQGQERRSGGLSRGMRSAPGAPTQWHRGFVAVCARAAGVWTTFTSCWPWRRSWGFLSSEQPQCVAGSPLARLNGLVE